MRLEHVDKIKKALPRGFRIKFVPGSLEGTSEFIWRTCPPNYNFIQKASRIGFLGFFRDWKTIGELDDDVDIIFLREEYYNEFFSIIKNLLKKIPLEGVLIERGLTLSGRQYRQRLVGGPLETNPPPE